MREIFERRVRNGEQLHFSDADVRNLHNIYPDNINALGRLTRNRNRLLYAAYYENGWSQPKASGVSFDDAVLYAELLLEKYTNACGEIIGPKTEAHYENYIKLCICKPSDVFLLKKIEMFRSVLTLVNSLMPRECVATLAIRRYMYHNGEMHLWVQRLLTAFEGIIGELQVNGYTVQYTHQLLARMLCCFNNLDGEFRKYTPFSYRPDLNTGDWTEPFDIMSKWLGTFIYDFGGLGIL
jgi:hypothetical protein